MMGLPGWMTPPTVLNISRLTVPLTGEVTLECLTRSVSAVLLSVRVLILEETSASWVRASLRKLSSTSSILRLASAMAAVMRLIWALAWSRSPR